MSTPRHFYRPEAGHGLKHDPFNSIIAPRPIGWVSTTNAMGQVNLAPYSFFNAFNYQPPIIGFSSIGLKDSARNAQQSGEFCWNLVSRSQVEAMNKTSAMVSSDTDEFEIAGLRDTHILEDVAIRSGEDIIFGESMIFDSNPETYSLKLPQGSLEIAAIPIEGWQQSIKTSKHVFCLNLVIVSNYFLHVIL